VNTLWLTDTQDINFRMTETANTSYIYPVLHSRAVKVFIRDEIRRFSFSGVSFLDFCSELKQLLDLSVEFSVRYQDDEGDWVTLGSDHELNHAFLLFGSTALRVKVVEIVPEKNTSAPATPSAPAAPLSAPVLFDKKLWKEAKKEAKLLKTEYKFAQKQAKMDRKAEKIQWKLAAKMSPSAPLSARFVKHVSVEDNYEFLPGTAFTKTWRFRNDGLLAWPENTVLLYVGKQIDNMGAPNSVFVGRSVLPGEEVDISVPMVAPAEPGSYFGYWRLAQFDGRKFGQRVRVLIKVTGDSTSSDDTSAQADNSWGDLLTQLESMGFKNRGSNVKLLVKNHGDLEKVVYKLLKKEQKKSGVK